MRSTSIPRLPTRQPLPITCQRATRPRRRRLPLASGLLCLGLLFAGLSPATAATNLLTNPGFEDGQTGWDVANAIRGGTSMVITNASLAHSGNNCISNYNPSGWSSAYEGDSMGGWSTGVSLPVSTSNYYKLSAWVKVPGASTLSQAITLRYRFEPSGSRVDVGPRTITNENWTLLESPWLQPPSSDYFMSYWEVHTLNNAVAFYADDCALLESTPLALSGRVVDGTGTGVDGVTISATSTGWTPPSTTTSGGGYYTLNVPPGTYAIAAAKALYSPGSASATISTGPVTAPTITITALPTALVSGKVYKMVGASQVGVAGAVVSANYAGGPASVSAPSAADGSYSVAVLVGSQVSLSAAAAGELPFSSPAAFTAPSTSPVTGKDIRVADVPQANSLLFSVVTENLPASGATGNWPTFIPAGSTFFPFAGTPTVQQFGGVKWEYNQYTPATGFQLQDPAIGAPWAYTAPIPVDGATIVLAAKPKRNGVGNPWVSIVDIFYGQLCLGVQDDSGRIVVKIGDTVNSNPTYVAPANTAIPDGQPTIISLVVSNSGQFVVYTNGTPIWTNTATLNAGLGFTSLTPAAPGTGTYAEYINLGKNQPDGWPVYNGYIGDVFVYTNALADTDRQSLEATLKSWFIDNATLSYPVTATAGANGAISPAGTTSVVQGYSQTYTMTANPGYVVSGVLVDGVSVGAVTSYTFSNVATSHTIAVNFVSMPPQTITASVTGSGGTISPSGAISVPAGSSQTFAMTPNSGYAVSNVVVDGISQGEIYSYNFPFVLAPHTISVTFRALDMNVPKADQLIFSVVANVLTNIGNATGPWPTYVPAGKTLTVQGGAPTSVIGVGGSGPTPGNGTNIWESNLRASGDGYRYPGGVGTGGEYLSSIPCSGATIIAVAAPATGQAADGWNSIVDVFYDRLTLGIRNDTGAVFARVNGSGANSTDLIPSYQPTVLSMVVQPDGSYNVWANTALVLSGSGSTLTNLVPGAPGYSHFIDVGRNDPDGWTAFNGNIGDVFLYKTALTPAERTQMEARLMAKYGAPLPPTYLWAGANNAPWSNPANWSTMMPGFANVAVFSATNAGATVQLDAATTVKGLQFNNLVPNTTIVAPPGQTLSLDDGTLGDLAPLITDAGAHTVSAGLTAPVGVNKTGPGKLTLSGTVNLGAAGTANPAVIVSGTGSELALAGSTTLSMGKGTRVTGNGKLTITGAYATGGSDVIIGENNTPGQVVLGGTGGWTNTGGGVFVVGNDQPGAVGTVTINDNATLDLSGMNSGFLNLAVGWNNGSAGTIVQNGGTVRTLATAGAWNGPSSPGVVMGNWTGDPCYAEYDLNGGTLITPNIYNVNSSGGALVAPNGSALFKFNGGILRATQNDSTDPQVVAEGSTNLMGNLTHAYVQAGGAKIDTAGFNCGIGQALETDPALGATLDGGLTKQGSGTLALYKPSTYTGPTKVQAGVLAGAAANTLGGGAVDISTGARLELDFIGTRVVSQLTFNGGAPVIAGTYGATGSGATHIDDAHFAGTGTITVPVPTPSLPITALTISGGLPSFTFNTVAGYKYRMVYKEVLSAATWLPVIAPPNNPAPDGWSAISTGAPLTITDPGAAARPQRFYRIEATTP